MFHRLAGNLFTAVGVLAIAVGTMATPNAAWAQASAKKVKVQIAHGASDGYHMYRALLQMKDKLEKSGRYTVRIFPSSQLGNDTETTETVSTGDVDMVLSPSSFVTKYSKRMNFIEPPYVYPSREVAIDVLNGEWGKKARSELGTKVLVGIGYMENGLRHLTNNKAEVTGPNDLKGMKLRTMQVPAHVEFWSLTSASASGSPLA